VEGLWLLEPRLFARSSSNLGCLGEGANCCRTMSAQAVGLRLSAELGALPLVEEACAHAHGLRVSQAEEMELECAPDIETC
jgi:hypothetical protein